MKRRDLLKTLAVAGAVGASRVSFGQSQAKTDGTPLQFMPKTPKDPNPLENELEKYPKCPYCGMDRTQWHHSRHLVHYDDDLADGTCSLHCAAISLSLNMDRMPKAIYAADYGSTAKTKPLINVDEATYLIGSDIKGTMTARSKLAFAEVAAARATRKDHGGEIGNFDAALTAAYEDMAKDTIMIRKRRAERRSRMEGK